MNVFSEDLLNKILNAPVGKVVSVLRDTHNVDIKLEVIEQNTVLPDQFVRKVSITAHGFPVIKAIVKFDSTILPEVIMAELLKKKQGVGDILNANNIKATRNVISLSRNHDENKVTREYEIIYNGIVWFIIIEEIRLDNLGSNNNS